MRDQWCLSNNIEMRKKKGLFLSGFWCIKFFFIYLFIGKRRGVLRERERDIHVYLYVRRVKKSQTDSQLGGFFMYVHTYIQARLSSAATWIIETSQLSQLFI